MRATPRVCASTKVQKQCIVGAGSTEQGDSQMMYRSMVLAVAALSSVQASAADLQSVYVAPGGVFISSGHVYVAPGVANAPPPYVEPGPAYAPGYVAPAPAYAPGYVTPYAPGYVTPRSVYRAPAYYGAGSVYAPPPPYIERGPAYVSPYAAEFAPRPPAALPYDGGGRCVDGYGRVAFCR